MKIESLFRESLIYCSNTETVQNFIADLLTPTEKIVLSKRLAIAYLLEKGFSYETIEDILKVTSSTVGTISLMLKHRGTGIRTIFNKVQRNRQVKNILEELGELAIELMGRGKGGNWKETKAYLYQRKLEKKSPMR